MLPTTARTQRVSRCHLHLGWMGLGSISHRHHFAMLCFCNPRLCWVQAPSSLLVFLQRWVHLLTCLE